MSRRAGGLLLASLLFVADPAAEKTRTLDDFESISAWRAAPSEGVRLALSSAEAPRGRALRLDFDFQGRAGWAAARRAVSIDLPENYEFAFGLRGEAPANDLEIKLIDSTGENVWWSVRHDFQPPREWRRIRLKKRHFSFAWGPAGGGEIRHVAALEIVVTARDGGKGWIAIEDLTFTALPPPRPPTHPPALTASSSAPGHPAKDAMDGNSSTSWRSAGPGPAWLAIDFGESREFGGLTVQWEPGLFASSYRVETSDDGKRWTIERTVEGARDGRNDLYLPESESRYVRLSLLAGAGRDGFGIREIVVQPLSYSESPNAFFQALAKAAPRGTYPRSFSGEQSYWTVCGVEGDTSTALLGEDGAVEPWKGAFSVEPFLFLEEKLLRWSDVAADQSLEDGDLPIPTVTWRSGPYSLTITAVAFGPPGKSSLAVRYRVENSSAWPARGKLFLAVRPFQVNPPTQFLNGPGGATPIRSLEWDGSTVILDGSLRAVNARVRAAFGAAPFEAGPISDLLAVGELPSATSVGGGFEYASGALGFDLELTSRGSDEVSVEFPLHPDSGDLRIPAPPLLARQQASALFARRLADCARGWRERLGRFGIEAPSEAKPLLQTLRSNLAYALVERDGPAIRPGTRSYARSWIRDGALISAALLRLGHAEAVRDYIAWFARYQDPDGRVPCCVDRRGADAVAENDSHGEFLFLIAEYWRFEHDRAFLERLFPNVERAVSYIDSLRQKERTGEYREPGKLLFFGLLPESISHEGYSAKPVHSYWDDFWALKGIADASDLAGALGREDLRARWSADRDEFSKDLLASLSQTISSRGLSYIPGSAELADFDPTATTIALDPAGLAQRLPRNELTATFERYFQEFRRRSEGKAWDAYTPYEVRTVGAFVRLGWRERVGELLDFFMAGRRPAAWNGWAEVVGRDPRAPRFIGDLPHAWVGSDFIRSLLDLFAFEREDGALVLAAGIPAGWLASGREVGVRRLRTPHGPLSYSLRREKDGLRFSVDALAVPSGGVVLRPPLEAPSRRVLVDGRPVPSSGEELILRRLPAVVLFER